MKRITSIFLFLFLPIFLPGCLTTLYPIFFKEDVLFDPSLLGEWKCRESNRVKFIEFKKIPENKKKFLKGEIADVSDKGYYVSRLDSTGKVLTESFVFLAKLGNHYYLDNYPAELSNADLVDPNFRSALIRAHTSFRIDLIDFNHFILRRIDKGYLDKLIKSNKINIRYIIIDGESMITAGTKDLRRFIIQYGENLKAYATDEKYERVNIY